MTISLDDPLHPIHRRREVWVKRANLPLRGGEFTFTWDRVHKQVRDECQAWAANVASGAVGPGLLLYGAPGQGKTSAAALTLYDALMKGTDAPYGRCPGHVASRPGYFIAFADFIRTYKKSWEPDQQEASRLIDDLFYSSTDTWERAKILVLDDVGKEYVSGTGFSIHVLHDLLRSRWDKGALTIITTNTLPENFGEVYGDAMGSFIHEAFLWQRFLNQPDKRRER